MSRSSQKDNSGSSQRLKSTNGSTVEEDGEVSTILVSQRKWLIFTAKQAQNRLRKYPKVKLSGISGAIDVLVQVVDVLRRGEIAKVENIYTQLVPSLNRGLKGIANVVVVLSRGPKFFLYTDHYHEVRIMDTFQLLTVKSGPITPAALIKSLQSPSMHQYDTVQAEKYLRSKKGNLLPNQFLECLSHIIHNSSLSSIKFGQMLHNLVTAHSDEDSHLQN